MLLFEKTGADSSLTRTLRVRAPGNGGAAFTAAASTTSGGDWLAVTPSSGSTPAELTVSATTAALQPGTYAGAVTITPAGEGATPVVVSAVLRIAGARGGSGTVLVRPGQLSFHMAQGGPNPEERTLNVSVPTGGDASWTVATAVSSPSGGTWLHAQPVAGTGSAGVAVSVNGTGLAAGQYAGTVTVTSGTTTVQVPVSFEVRANEPSQLVIDPRAFNFIVLPNAPAPAPKTLRIGNGASVAFDWTATTSSGWLTIAPTSGTGAGIVTLTVNPAGLSQGMYAGSVAVTASGRTETARVFLRLVGSPSSQSGTGSSDASSVQIDPRVVEFNAPVGGPASPASVAVQIASQTTGLAFAATASTVSGGNWLAVDPASGSIPGTLTLTANATGLAAGIYSGLVKVDVAGSVSEQRNVVVRLRVGAAHAQTPRLRTHPGAAVFEMVQGGPAPAASHVSVVAMGAASVPFSATSSTVSGGDWLAVDPASGSAPTTLSISVKNTAALTAGVYRGSVVLQSTGTPSALPAKLNVLLAVRSASTTAESDSAITGVFVEPGQDFLTSAHMPESVRVALFHENGTPVQGADVRVESSGNEPAFELDNVGGGFYSGVFQPLASGPVSLSASATVRNTPAATFSIGGDVDTDDSSAPTAFQGGVVNGADFAPAPSPVAAGAILSLFGKGLADSSAAATGFPLPNQLGGLMLLVGGVQAPLISVVPGTDFDQINFQAPVELNGQTFADVVVVKNGAASAPVGLSIAAAVPALFTRDATGRGIAAALHSDYRPITNDNPAKPGETILLYATGLGRVQGSQVSGEASGASRVVADVQVTINGVAAETTYAGLAPGYAGLYQVNATVPDSATAGDAPVVLVVDGIVSGDGVVIPIG